MGYWKQLVAERRFDKYRDDEWALLPTFGRASGKLQLVRASALSNADTSDQISNDLLQYLFERTDIGALGGRCSVSVLSSFLRQLAEEDPQVITVVWATPWSVQLMRKKEANKELRADPVLIGESDCLEPRLAFHDRPGILETPKRITAMKSEPLRFFYSEHDGARPYTVITREIARADGREAFNAEQWLYTYAPPSAENEARLQRGLAPMEEAQRIIHNDGTTVAIELPTIMVFRIRPGRPNRDYQNMRMGFNFSPGGDYLCGLCTKISGFQSFLEFFPNELESAVTRSLEGCP